MALLSSLPEQCEPRKNSDSKHGNKRHQHTHQNQKQQIKRNQTQKQKTASSWDQIKNLLSCKQVEGPRVHDPSKNISRGSHALPSIGASSCRSFCKFSDVVLGNARVFHRADNSPETSSLGQDTGLLTRKPVTRGLSGPSGRSNSGASYTSSSSRGMHLRKLSGCYECHMIVDPNRVAIAPRVRTCPQCGEVFTKLESLELHQATRHAVSELGPDDSGRNIVDIIFKSSWLRKDGPVYKIVRILKVHNTLRTIQRFEDCRDAVKSRALAGTRKDPRCAADGNELLRFHCATVSCSLGARGSTGLCDSVPGCGVCTIIRHGFQDKTVRLGGGGKDYKGVRTECSSGRAHESLRCIDSRRAMLVCRVIAGRVKRAEAEDTAAATPVSEQDSGASYDSVAGSTGIYSSLEELVVSNPKALLPCFVVVYKVFEA